MAAERLLENQAAAITQKCISMAMQGDITAIKLCLSRLIPTKLEREISLEIPPIESSQDSLTAIATVLEAVGAGMITPNEAQAVASLLETHRRTFEVEEMERRLEALEAQVCGAN